MLHIVNKSPFDANGLAGVLRVANKDGAALLLIEDGVYAAVKGGANEVALKASGIPVYVLQPDSDARGLQTRLMDGVSMVDYGGFVDLVAAHSNVQSWL